MLKEVGTALSRLLGASDVRQLASELDLRPTKKRGQNFVIDANTVRSIINKAEITNEDVVLEIGPGLGSLTLGLLETAKHVIAIEIEDALAEQLPKTVAKFAQEHADKLTVVNQDALEVNETPEPQPNKLVANLPYNVSVPVLLHWFALAPSIESGLVMVQSEVADRLVAPPGSRTYGIPSVKAAWFGRLTLAGAIGRNVFWPAPNVDSALVRWQRHDPPLTTATRANVFEVIDIAFAQRRKTLRAALAKFAGSPDLAESALLAANIDPKSRGEELSVAQFARLAETLKN